MTGSQETNMLVDLSIIIVNFNTRNLLKDCLDSVKDSIKKITYQIFVVDNNSSDGSVEMVRSKFPDVHLIQNNKNIGFAKANNQAIKLNNARYVLLLNSDTIVRPCALDLMVSFMDDNAKVGALSPKLIDGNDHSQPISGFQNPWKIFLRFYNLKMFLSNPNVRRFMANHFGKVVGKTIGYYLEVYRDDPNPREVDCLGGACLMVRSETISQVGLLDENFFMYLEDVDWCKRISSAGWTNIYFPKATVTHLVGQSSGGNFRDFHPEAYKSIYYYYKKHRDKKDFFIVKFLIISALIIRIIGLFSVCIITRNKKKRLDIGQKLISYVKIVKLSLTRWKYRNIPCNFPQQKVIPQGGQ
jgi:GT2 family glycosyltransferase